MKVKPRSKKHIEIFTNKIREILQLSNNQRIDIVKFMEDVLEAFEIDLIIEEDQDMPNEYALFSPTEMTLRIQNTVYVEACNGNGRHRLTIGHELGHIFQKHGEEAVLTRSTERVPIYCDPEWQAYVFARNILCPLNGITSEDNEDTLAERYGISLEVAKIQISESLKK